MPKTPKFNEKEWEEIVDLILDDAAKAYICRLFAISPAQLKKVKKKIKLK